MKPKFVIIICTLLLVSICVSCTSSDFNERLNNIVKGERFSIAKWEVGAVAGEIWQSLILHESPDRSDVVVAYFKAVETGKTETADGTPLASLRPRVEKIIQQQVRNVINGLSIKNPVDNFLGIHFPPLSFVLSKPPDLLVTSPRDKIAIFKEVRLQPDLTVAQMESIESQTEQLGVSALVTESVVSVPFRPLSALTPHFQKS